MSEQAELLPINLEQLHGLLLGATKALDEMLKKNHIDYWLHAGTLLGAIRHQGFIPWDDDVDIAMTREDYTKFLSVVDDQLPPGLSHLTKDRDKIAVNSKIAINGTFAVESYQAANGLDSAEVPLSIDVFVLDNAASRKSVRKLEGKVAFVLGARPWAHDLSHSPIEMPRAKRLRWRAMALMPQQWATAGQEVLLRRGEARTTDWNCCALDTQYAHKTYPRRAIAPQRRVWFEGLELPAPQDPSAYLECHFGPDFMTPSPPDERRIHHTDTRATSTALKRWQVPPA